jgi:HEPN domain-containing protein
MSNKFKHQYEIYYKKATADFVLVQQVHLLNNPQIDESILLFHLQQAAEKYLKTLLSFKKIHFAKLHDIKKILDLYTECGIETPPNAEAFIELTPYAVEGRYDFIVNDHIDIPRFITLLEQLKMFVESLIFNTDDGNI